jgi:protein-tyrosine phosphatase
VVTERFNILTVCTMNICRSPAMELILLRSAQEKCSAGSAITVQSAGTDAIAGMPGCELSLAYAGSAELGHESRQLTEGLLDDVDLVLTAAWSHAAKVVSLEPQIRSRCFPVRLAARLATYVVESDVLTIAQAKAAGEVIDRESAGQLAMVPALPVDQLDRLRWLVSEMNESRGIAPRPPEHNLPYGVDDIPDPHVLGYNLHELSATMIAESIAQFVSAAEIVINSP